MFEALFASVAREAVEKELKIEADSSTVANLLRHIYGLPITLSVAELPQLLMLADMYEVRTVQRGIGAAAGPCLPCPYPRVQRFIFNESIDQSIWPEYLLRAMSDVTAHA